MEFKVWWGKKENFRRFWFHMTWITVAFFSVTILPTFWFVVKPVVFEGQEFVTAKDQIKQAGEDDPRRVVAEKLAAAREEEKERKTS